jgi:aspartyl-tRNA(Asn)/glutamyl-tRNA(Gln) amidotransferase subunit B
MSQMQYEAVIGLEIHAELITRSKMFCACSADYASAPEPNTLICPVCTGLPGSMPVVNRRAVEQAIMVGLALHCQINPMNVFARKNYYYPDLPKGYQISQYDLPIAVNGWLDVSVDETPVRVRVRRAHLEEDTAKLFHQGQAALVDFNRAGIPLLEIVSEPDMHSVEAVLAYATQIRAILRYLGVNSGDMEKGVLRFEANVSVRPVGSQELRTRTEIKNLNSFRALTRAVAYEIQRQTAIYEAGGEVVQETLGWDDVRGITLSQRGKEEAHDYRYFPEPDLPPLEIDPAWIESLRAQLPELPEARGERFLREYGLKRQDARLLTSEKALADYFEAVVRCAKSKPHEVSNWITGEFLRCVNDFNASIDAISLPPQHLARLIDMVSEGTLNASSAKLVLREIFQSGQSPQAIVEQRNLAQISDEGYLTGIIAQVLDENPDAVASYLAGKETVLQWLMGQIARQTRGKANPQIARHLLLEMLKKRQGERKKD